jgi:TatD DNase family protein
MFSDTHFHLHHIWERGLDVPAALKSMATHKPLFGLDIGTRCDDLFPRGQKAQELVAAIDDDGAQEIIKKMMYFSAGIWPAEEAILDRFNQIKVLESTITQAMSQDDFCGFGKGRLVALGECGLDHHWNPAGVDQRNEESFTAELFHGEAEFFEMQLELARKLHLPVIVHSRDAFEGTLDCIKNVAYDRGIIHCYSYGKHEARSFLDRGWYISLSGAITYTKKARMPEMEELIRYIPQDRLLLETDAPYLAPVPHRGKINAPNLVVHTYNYVAEILKTSPEALSMVVDANIKELFVI